jgi:hypothetical protein
MCSPALYDDPSMAILFLKRFNQTAGLLQEATHKECCCARARCNRRFTTWF